MTEGETLMALRADDVDLGRDRDLVDRHQRGDLEAFDDLYRRYFNRLNRYCQRHTADRHEAEEAAQEAFVRAFRSMDTFQGERRFYPWLTVIAKRIIIDRHRKDARLEPVADPDSGSVEADHDHIFDAVDHAHVRQALAQVGPRHREVLLLREAHGLAYAQIADHLDVPLTTVEALLHRARKALRREFAKVAGVNGLASLPLLGWIGTKIASARSHVGDHWIQIGVIAAPAAVAAFTAAAIIIPTDHTPPPAAWSPPAVFETVDIPVDMLDELELANAGGTPTAPAWSRPTTTDSVGSSPPAPEPSVDAGAVDVYVGDAPTDTARTRARDMPDGAEAGPATFGADLAAAIADAADYPTRNETNEPPPAIAGIGSLIAGDTP
jgi:RNA polymerase sigma-70 factor (ECF subfamily)